MATPDNEHTTATDTSPAKPRKRRWFWRLLRGVTIFALILLALNFAVGLLYHGPRTMPGIVAAMPGVPIFPLARVSPSNPRAQRAMALPLWFMRLQGARHAEAAQILAPADDYFVTYWYRQSALSMGWRLAGEQQVSGGRRLVFLREREGLQVVIGKTRDIFTPVQLVYLSGMADAQLEQLASGLPIESDRDFPPPPEHTTVKPVTPPTTPTTPVPVPTTPANPANGAAQRVQPSGSVHSTGSSPSQQPTQATNKPAAQRATGNRRSATGTVTRRATSTPRSSSTRVHRHRASTTRHHRTTVHQHRQPTSAPTRRSVPTTRPSAPMPSYRKPIGGEATAPSPTTDTPQAPAGE